MPFVERFAGAIVGEFACPRPQANEFADDDAPELLAFRAGRLPGSAAKLPGERAAAKALLASDPAALAKALRAVVALLLSENNLLRQWLAAFKGQVALAANLADLKTRVAALPPMPDRTMAQAKTAIAAEIDLGAAD